MRACGIVSALAVLLAASACDKLPFGAKDEGGTKDPAAAAEPAAKPAAPEKAPAGAASDGEKGRFIKAYVEAACAVKNAPDMTKAVDLTRSAYEKHGFNQISYAGATQRYAGAADVKAELDKGLKICAGPAAPAGDAKPAGPAAAKPGEAKADIPSWAVKPAAPGAAGDAPAADAEDAPAKAKDGTEPEKKASPYTGIWKGNFTGGDASGSIQITVKENGKFGGSAKPQRPAANAMAFSGTVSRGKFILNARGGPNNALFNGKIDKKVVSGQWSGMVGGKKRKGTWRAALK